MRLRIVSFVPRKGLIVAGAIFLVVLLSSYTFAAEDTLRISILHMNDPHAHYIPYQEKDETGLIGGFAKAATVIKREIAENERQRRKTLVLCGGDLLTGTPLSTVWKGEMGVKLMNEMGFTAMVVGNHEFDFGRDHLVARLEPMMRFPLLSANILDQQERLVFKESMGKTFPPSQTPVVIFGLTTDQTPITTHPRNVQGLTFLKPEVAANHFLKRCRNEDLVIALTHVGVDVDRQLAEAFPAIDVIVGGHTHTAIKEPLKVRDTIIVQAGAYARYVGKLDLDVKRGRVVRYEGRLIPPEASLEEDPQIAAVIEQYKSRMDAQLKTVIGSTQILLEGGRSEIRSGKQTNLGKLITFTMAESVNADAAVVNGGGIRASLHEGDITLSDIYTVLPFGATVVKMDLNGVDLAKVMQRSLELPEGSGGKLQTYGIAWDARDGRVTIRQVGARGFDPQQTYSIATNDFLMAGGDGYTMFKEAGKNVYQDSSQISDLLIDFIRDKKVISTATLDAIPDPPR
jgi:5'-nucleotidase